MTAKSPKGSMENPHIQRELSMLYSKVMDAMKKETKMESQPKLDTPTETTLIPDNMQSQIKAPLAKHQSLDKDQATSIATQFKILEPPSIETRVTAFNRQ